MASPAAVKLFNVNLKNVEIINGRSFERKSKWERALQCIHAYIQINTLPVVAGPSYLCMN
jgi:hypothetical protein